MSTQRDILDTARLAYYDIELCVLPPVEDGSKKPQSEYKTFDELADLFGKEQATEMCTKDGVLQAGRWTWKHFQHVRPTVEQMGAWYRPKRGSPRSGVGLVTGRISKNLKLFEIEDMATFERFCAEAENAGLGELVARIRAGYEETTPGNGMHWLVYCDVPCGNTELAKGVDENGEIHVIIETREEGGFTIIAPTNGRVHRTGGTYELVSGGLDQIVTITPEEWRQLCELARTFDQLPTADETGFTFVATGDDDDRPGDVFNERATWREILEPHGWTLVRTQGRTEFWRRPGDTDHDYSATINAPAVKPDRFWCWSTSTVFRSKTVYTKFAVYAILNHGGDWSAAGKALYQQGYRAPQKASVPNEDEALSGAVTDFYAYLPEHKYLYRPTRDLWPAASVNANIPPFATGRVDAKGKEIFEAASARLDRERAVMQMTWIPGEAELIEGRLMNRGGWIERVGVATFNLYIPPTIEPGDAGKAGRWIEHVEKVYPVEADHILDWLAQRVQRPGEKINHALVLGGEQGIGKDTILEPVRHAVGAWNVAEASPVDILGAFNPYVESVMLRISEARDLGDWDRWKFYEHTKTLIASPPDIVMVNRKFRQPYAVPNVCAVVFTTNYKIDGIYLPPDDRRHYVTWSELTKDDFDGDYWTELYRWYERSGHRHVAAYLAERDIRDFDAKAPPPKTSAFWDIVDANRAPEDAELADVLDRLGWSDALTLRDIIDAADTNSFAEWLQDRKNNRQIPHRMEEAGYVRVRNPAQKDNGRWKVRGKNVAIYARRHLSRRDQLAAATALATEGR